MEYHHPLLFADRPGVVTYGGARMALLDLSGSFWALRRHLEAMVGARLADNVMHQAGAASGASFARSLAGPLGPLDVAAALQDCVAAFEASGFGHWIVERLEWPVGRISLRCENSPEAWSFLQHGKEAERPVCAYAAGVLVGYANVLGGRRDVVCVERECIAQGAPACRFELLPAGESGSGPSANFDPDPFLGLQLSLLEVLFDRMPMGIAVMDTGLALRRFNPTLADFVARYTDTPERAVVPGATMYELLPEMSGELQPMVEQNLAGEHLLLEAVPVRAGGITSYWDLAAIPLSEQGRVAGIVHVLTDATDRVLAYQLLERRVEGRTREIERRRAVAEGLREMLTVLNSDRPLVEILNRIVLLAGQLLGTDTVAVWKQEEGALRLQASCGDVSLEYPSVLSVPLIIKDEVYGSISLYYRERREFTQEDVALAASFADQSALAIENARLRERTEQAAVAAERSRLARDLHDAVTQTLFSASLIADVAPRLWDRDREEGRRRLAELRQLTRGALAEMRTLLLELRPGALVEARLSDLLVQLAEAVIGRTRFPVSVTADESITLPPQVQVAFYRVAQEALSWAARSPGATGAAVSLTGTQALVSLSITVEGGAAYPLRPALAAMRERARSAGVTLRISRGGARVKLHYQPKQEVQPT